MSRDLQGLCIKASKVCCTSSPLLLATSLPAVIEHTAGICMRLMPHKPGWGWGDLCCFIDR